MLWLRCWFFTLKKQVKKNLKITLYYHHLNSGGGGEWLLLSGGGGRKWDKCLLSHPSSYINSSPLSKHPHPLPPPTMNLSLLFFPATISYEESIRDERQLKVVFCFHFWYLSISNLNGYQGQISAHLPAPSYQVLMHIRPICYIEWWCLVLEDADSFCEKSFSPTNDKGTKWETTPQVWEGLIYECYHTDWINFSCNKSHFKATEILKKFNQI